MERRCPRCPDAPLMPARGALHEDVCGDCGGRFLDDQATLLLCERHLRVGPAILKDLTREGPRRLTCPGCRSRMTLTLLRGVQVDLCGGCGGAWLDEGELSSLTRGQLVEVGSTTLPVVQGMSLLDEARAVFGDGVATAAAAPTAPTETPTTTTTTTATTTTAAPGWRAIGDWEVRCIACDEALDLQRTNWLINQRPWCARCAAPHTGLGGVVDSVVDVAAGLLGRRRYRPGGPSLLDAMFGGVFESVDLLRIEPADAEVHFGPFFRPVVDPPQPR